MFPRAKEDILLLCLLAVKQDSCPVIEWVLQNHLPALESTALTKRSPGKAMRTQAGGEEIYYQINLISPKEPFCTFPKLKTLPLSYLKLPIESSVHSA